MLPIEVVDAGGPRRHPQQRRRALGVGGASGRAEGDGGVEKARQAGHVREGEALVAVGGVSTSGMQVQQVYELMRRQMEATSGTTITMQFAARV